MEKKRDLCAGIKGTSYTVISEEITFDTHDRTSLFCFTAYTKNTGSTKTNYELDLIKEVYKMKAHIFACDKAAVYGDVEVDLGPDMKIQKVEDIENEFHLATRKHMGTWIHT